MATQFSDEDLRDALDGLFAYDEGATDSGIHDELLKKRCRHELETRSEDRIWITKLIRDMWMSDEALELGYGIEDALDFVNWLRDHMGIDL